MMIFLNYKKIFISFVVIILSLILTGFSDKHSGSGSVSTDVVKATLPFSSLEWKAELFNQPNQAVAIKPIGDNSALQRYLNSLPQKGEYQGYLHLPKQQREFDSYIVIEGDRHHLVNIDNNGQGFMLQNIAAQWSKSYQEANNHWTVYSIDRLFNFKVNEAQVRYSQLQKKFLITQKLNEQRYHVTKDGTIVQLSNKTFPNPDLERYSDFDGQEIIDDDVNNPDNCFNAIMLSYLSSDIELLPLSNLDDSYDDLWSDIDLPDQGLGGSAFCIPGVFLDYLPVFRLHNHGVFLVKFRSIVRPTYLVTANEDGKVNDMMAIGLDKNGDFADFKINQDYSIDLIIRSPDGKQRKQTFFINPQGEFE